MSETVKKSVAKEKCVHGVVVRRLPVGEYLAAAESLRELPQSLLSRLFPDMTTDEAFLQLKYLRTDTLLKLVGTGTAAVGQELVGFFAVLLGIPLEKIRDELTPSELSDILYELWRLNDLSNFIKRVRGALAALKQTDGSNG